MTVRRVRLRAKTRTRQHIIADMSFNHFERFVLECGHVAEPLLHDYGYDVAVFTYDENGELEPGQILVQLKATDNLDVLKDGMTISFPMDRRDLKVWLRELPGNLRRVRRAKKTGLVASRSKVLRVCPNQRFVRENQFHPCSDPDVEPNRSASDSGICRISQRTLVAAAMGGAFMNHFVTYGRLREFLLNLGFEDRSGDYLAFSHPEVRSALLCMAFHEPDEPMLERDLVKVRGVLELSGLMERDEFDAWVRNKKPRKATAS